MIFQICILFIILSYNRVQIMPIDYWLFDWFPTNSHIDDASPILTDLYLSFTNSSMKCVNKSIRFQYYYYIENMIVDVLNSVIIGINDSYYFSNPWFISFGKWIHNIVIIIHCTNESLVLICSVENDWQLFYSKYKEKNIRFSSNALLSIK